MFSRFHFASAVLLTAGWIAAFCGQAMGQELTMPAPVPVPAIASGSTNPAQAMTSLLNAPASPALQAPTGNADNSMWVLSPNDQVAMTVYQEEDLKAETTIDVNGMVMLPLVGEVKVGGMTLAQATARIQQLYDKDYLVNPQVNLVVEKFAARHFSVLGQVQRPGSFDFPQNESVSLLEAIAMAGGYTRLGAPSKVSVLRAVNGTPQVYHVDADQLAQDPTKKAFPVLPNDVITVGERAF